MSLAFSHLNLRRNPFGAVTLEEHTQLAVVDTDDYVEWLRRPGRMLQFTGRHGRGKTTHLLAIRRHFSDAPYIRAKGRHDALATADHPVIFVDEAQWLSGRQRKTLFCRNHSYAVSTHEALDDVAQRAGLEVRSVELSGLTTDELARICERRIEFVRRDDGPLPTIDDATIDALIERHGDDLRAIEEHLYEVFQALDGVRAVRASDL